MNASVMLLWGLNIGVDTFGHLAFKRVAGEEGDGLARWRRMAARPALWAGIACFIVEFLVWLAFLSLVPLAQGVLMGMINIVAVMLAGYLFFGERLSRLRVAGVTLIVLGVAVVGAS